MGTRTRPAKWNRVPALTLALVALVAALPTLAMKGDFSRGHAPDTKRSKPMPQTREHVLLGRQVGAARVLEEWDGSSSLTREVIYGLGAPLWQLLPDGSSQYFHEDPRGNVVALTEGVGSPTAATGDVLERVTYDPYGTPVFQDAANANKTDRFGVPVGTSDLENTLLFGGLWYDPATSLRNATSNDDFGGWYLVVAQYYSPNTGRHTTRSRPDGDPDRPIVVGRVAYTEVHPYAASGQSPVNTSATGGHELGHSFGKGAQDKSSGMATGRRTHKPIFFKAVVANDGTARKRPGRVKWSPAASDPETTPRAKENFRRSKIHVSIPSAQGTKPEDIVLVGPNPPAFRPGIEHEDIGAPRPALPGIEHEDIGAPTSTRNCVCVSMPYPCGQNVCVKIVCGGRCGGGGGLDSFFDI